MSDTAAEQWALREITTRTLIDLNYKLEIRCRSCGHETVAEPYELWRMFPTATSLHVAGQRLRCERCGAKNPQMWVWVMGWTRDKPRRR
jgi:DNA-directed RNA polymerase subunit RPC12/RpoP